MAAVGNPDAGQGPSEADYKCAEQAEKTFKIAGYSTRDLANYTNHRNAKLGKCMMLIWSFPRERGKRNPARCGGGNFLRNVHLKHQLPEQDEFDKLIEPYMHESGPRPLH